MTEPGTIAFPTGVVARTTRAPVSDAGADVLARLDVPPPRGTIVLNGSTAPLGRAVRERLAEIVVDGVAALAVSEGLTVLTGGTDAGVFALLGSAMGGHRSPLIGVVPEGRVSWPGMRSRGNVAELEPLEPHHTHFVLVEADEWGDETPVLLDLAGALAQGAPAVAVLCGGGAGAAAEVLGHVRARRAVVVIAGSGRLADDIAAAAGHGGAVPDPDLAEIAAAPSLTVFPTDEGAAGLRVTLQRALGWEPGKP